MGSEKITSIKMLVDVLGYLLLAPGLHLLLVTVNPSHGRQYDGGRSFKKNIHDQFRQGGDLNPTNDVPGGGKIQYYNADDGPEVVDYDDRYDYDDYEEYEEKIDLNMERNNAQKMQVGRAVQSPLSVLLEMKSMPPIIGGKIIAGDSANVQLTVLKKLPNLEKKPEMPIDYPNYNEKIPPPPGDYGYYGYIGIDDDGNKIGYDGYPL